jgi:hypothetical protein
MIRSSAIWFDFRPVVSKAVIVENKCALKELLQCHK